MSESNNTTEVLYLTTLVCDNNHGRTLAHKDVWTPADQEPPRPDVIACPRCGIKYPDDMAEAVTSVHEAELVSNPEIAPEERGAKEKAEETDFESSGHQTRKQ